MKLSVRFWQVICLTFTLLMGLLVIANTGISQDGSEVKEVTFGALLPLTGNRKFYDYDFWKVKEDKGVFQWKRVARFHFDFDYPGRIIYMPLSYSPRLRILVVHSYHKEWGWDQDIQRGIVEGLYRKGYKQNEDYEIRVFYMDTKVTYTTPQEIEQRAEIAIDLIEKLKPDIVFVNDDNALKYVAVRYTQEYPDKKLPFVFSGINVDPTVYKPIESLKIPGGFITGALERFPYNECFSLGKRILPRAFRVVLLADYSPSSTFVVAAFKERYLNKIDDPPLQTIGPIQLKTFAEWKQKVLEYQSKADFICPMTYHQLRDENGIIVSAPEVVDWTVRNSKLPELGLLSFQSEDGFWASVGVSGYKTGIYVGIIGGEILNGSNPARISIVDPEVVEISFNLERTRMLGINIPTEELVKADEVFHYIGKTRY